MLLCAGTLVLLRFKAGENMARNLNEVQLIGSSVFFFKLNCLLSLIDAVRAVLRVSLDSSAPMQYFLASRYVS